MDHDPMTPAQWAQSSADNARRENRALAKRIADIELQVYVLETQMAGVLRVLKAYEKVITENDGNFL